MKWYRALRILTLLVLIASGFLATPRPVSAGAAITVTTYSDEFGTGTSCSLREAIYAANTDTAYGGCPAGSGTDYIYLSAGVYILTRNNPGGVHENAALWGDLDITQSVQIYGAGMDPNTGSVVYANPQYYSDRIFHIKPASGILSVTMSNLRIQGGNTSDQQGGGGILNNGSVLALYRVYITANHANVEGGGVTNYGGSTLNVRYSIFDTNTSADGGGIYNVGTMSLENSLLIGNSGTTTGGGLDNGSGSTATVRNTTVTQNLTSNDSNNGGGISNSGSLTLINNTIADNNGTGLLVESYAVTIISNTIFSQGAKPNCARKASNVTIVSQGYNIVYGSTAVPAGQYECTWSGTGDKVGTGSLVNPQLSPLGYDDSVTQTYGFTSTSSPAIDAIPMNNTNCPMVDQRMHGRRVDGNEDGIAGCDIGAYEKGGPLLISYLPRIDR